MNGSWAGHAVQHLRHRVATTAEQVGDRFPLHADSAGTWTSTRRGSWTGGFWAGLLGLRAAATGAETDRARARAAWEALAQWRDADTACRGMIFWYGGLAARRENTGWEPLRAAALSLAADLDPDLGAVPWGTAFGHSRGGLRVDGVAGLVPLLAWAGEPEVARQHLRSHLHRCFAGGAVQPALFTSDGGRTWQPADDPAPGSSRAHAWLLLGCADGAHWLGAEFLEPAVALARAWSDRFGHGVPPADADLPGGPVDTSAAAIAAVSFLKLAGNTGRQDWWRDGAALLHRAVDAGLVRSGPARGALGSGCYDAKSGIAPANELIWGDFFCAVGLGLITGDLPVDDP